MKHIKVFEEFGPVLKTQMVKKPINQRVIKSPTQQDAIEFVNDYLKLGSKNNLFHQYLKKKGYSDLEVGTFLNLVIDELEKWR